MKELRMVNGEVVDADEERHDVPADHRLAGALPRHQPAPAPWEDSDES